MPVRVASGSRTKSSYFKTSKRERCFRSSSRISWHVSQCRINERRVVRLCFRVA
jgi:hypothetical protein